MKYFFAMYTLGIWFLSGFVYHHFQQKEVVEYPPCEQISQSETTTGPNGSEVFVVFVCQTETGHELYGQYLSIRLVP